MSNTFYSDTSYFTNTDINADWSTDPSGFNSSDYVFDSPQPDNKTLPLDSTLENNTAQELPGAASHTVQQAPGEKRQAHIAIPQDVVSCHSSTSETSSHSSFSPSASKRQAYSASPPSALVDPNQPVPSNSAMTSQRPEDNTGMYDMGDTMVEPDETMFHGLDNNMNMDMDNLSLQSGNNFDFNATATSDPLSAAMFSTNPDGFPADAFTRNTLDSPPRTIQPNKMFSIGESREESPNDFYLGGKESPSFAMNPTSPLTGNPAVFGGDSAADTGMNFDYNQYPSGVATSLSNSMSPTSTQQSNPGNKWPCQLKVDPIPEKSRVETQIPIRLTLYKPPPGIKHLHLPTHTISKPKFLAKPPAEKSEDTLELSVLLVCASAMRDKEGAVERAFKRAESDDPPVGKEETSIIPAQQDDNDLERPLNGGPVTICSGCIVRERKRAARKKTKKQEEEEEWLKDETKRVIVFNCNEVREWCLVDGTKETPVKEHSGPLEAMTVSPAMRIACYCRHQQEKVGFQVIFTLKTAQGQIVAQSISDSIMITDDHKQPMPQAGAPTGMYIPAQMEGAPIFVSGQNPYGGLYESPTLPFRPSNSTPNLTSLGNQVTPQMASIQRQFSYNNIANNFPTQPSTASATPRNLSRPASPTGPPGQPGAKKRRSGGSTNKLPSNLHMTSLETRRNPHHAASNSNVTSAPASASFNFTSPTSSGFGATPLDQSLSHTPLRTPTHFTSGPGTPLPMHGSFTNDIDPSQFYSAPTSQHASRAPSPTSASRGPFAPPPNVGPAFTTSGAPSVPEATASALASLPTGFNINKPPIMQRLIPAFGPTTGNEDVTVLGSGFFQGLEVMFGDTPATNITFWGDTAIVARTPPTQNSGAVTVCFKHQHHSSLSRELGQMMPSRPVSYVYYHENGVSSAMQGIQNGPVIQRQTSGQFAAQTSNGMGAPSGSGTVSPPNVGGLEELNPAAFGANTMTANGLNQAAMNPRAYMSYGGQQQSPTPGSGSAGFNAANFARSQPALQQDAAHAMVAGRRVAPHRTPSGGPGVGR